MTKAAAAAAARKLEERSAKAAPQKIGLPVAYQAALDSGERILAKAVSEKVPMDQLEKLLSMRRELQAEAAKGAFLDAMAAFQQACPVIKKNKSVNVKDKTTGNVKYSYKYADLGFVVSIVKPLLAAQGLSYRIGLKYEKGEGGQDLQVAECVVSHVLGHSERSEFRAPVDKTAVVNDMQKAASAATFAKRQAFQNALGILTADEDNDGRGAGPAVVEGDQPAAAPERAGPRAAAAPAETGRLMPENKKRILRARMTSAGLTDELLERKFGKRLDFLDDGLFNNVGTWIQEHAQANA